jgi:hypothetical protein
VTVAALTFWTQLVSKLALVHGTRWQDSKTVRPHHPSARIDTMRNRQNNLYFSVNSSSGCYALRRWPRSSNINVALPCCFACLLVMDCRPSCHCKVRPVPIGRRRYVLACSQQIA